MRQGLGLASGLVAFALSLGGLRAATPPDVLVVAQNIDDIVSIDPAQAYEFSSGELVANTYDRLVEYTAEDTTKLVPGLATAWTIADKTITFTLRPGTRFQSGNPLRPEDVVQSFTRVVALNKAPAFILTQLGWTRDTIAAMVKAEGADKVTVAWTGSFSPAFVLNVLAARPAAIVDAKTVMAHETNGDMGNAWLNRNTAGTGAFRLRSFRPAETAILDANPDYFGGAPKLKSVIIRHVAEPATQRLLVETGDADLAKNLTPDQIAAIQGKSGIKVGIHPQAAVHFLSFNQKTEALTPKAVWQAARYLVNYQGMANSFLKGQMKIHQAFWPEGFPGALDDTPFTYDVARAKRILAEAGVKTPIDVTLDVINSPPFSDMAQALQASFAEAGINFRITPGTGSQVITRYRARAHQAMLLYWGPDFMDPHSNAKAFAYNNNNNDDAYQSTTTWRNAWAVPDALNAETVAALAEADGAKRDAMYVDLQKKVQAESPIIVMFQAVNQVAMSEAVKGYVAGATADFVFYKLVTKS